MATISSIGVGSGLDASSIINALLQVERRPIELLQTEAKALDAKLSSFGKVQSYLDSLRSAAERLKTASTWTATTAATSNSTAIKASAGSGTSPGSYSVSVGRLAAAQMTASPAKASASTVIGQGTLRIDIGSWNEAVDQFTPKTGNVTVDIPIGAGEDTLEGIRDKINATSGLGVKATIVNDASGSRLVLSSSATGAENGFRLQVLGDTDGDDADEQGLSQLAFDPETSPAFSTRPQAGQNAEATINGLEVSSTTNKFDSVIDGVTLEVAATTSSAADVTITRDTASMKSAVEAFVKSYNDLATLLRNETKYNEGSKSGATLQGDRTAIGLQGQLRSALGLSTSASTLWPRGADIGLDVQTDGTIKLGTSKLDAALQNTEELAAFFSADAATDAGKGLARRLSSLADAWLGTEGALTSRQEGLKKRIDLNEDRRAEMEGRVAATERRLRAQYTALDATMAQLSGLQNYVSQQVTNWNNS